MPIPYRPEAVVFDMDGLLFDTEALHEEAILAAVRQTGLNVNPVLFRHLLGRPWAENRTALLEHYGTDFPVDELRTVWLRHFDGMVQTRLTLKPGAIELLDWLDFLALPQAIATSSSHRDVQHHLAAHHLSDRFDVIVACGDYEAAKPAPDPFLKAAERLGVEPWRCLALEDSFNGVRAAARAGMMTVMVPDLLAPTDEIRSLCACVVSDLHQVGPLIEAAPSAAGMQRSSHVCTATSQ
jgi:HAD superfamily hydrolase (TIGR01509 family)